MRKPTPGWNARQHPEFLRAWRARCMVCIEELEANPQVTKKGELNKGYVAELDILRRTVLSIDREIQRRGENS